jgi:ketosteroid isomerase-like protein
MSDSDERDVLDANTRFYDAFVKRDLTAMSDLWHDALPVVCVHPGWAALEGRARVLASWRGILSNAEAPPIRCLRASVHLLGDMAMVVAHEALGGARLVATNVFAREGSTWRMVLHQAGPLAGHDDEDEVDAPDDSTMLN